MFREEALAESELFGECIREAYRIFEEGDHEILRKAEGEAEGKTTVRLIEPLVVAEVCRVIAKIVSEDKRSEIEHSELQNRVVYDSDSVNKLVKDHFDIIIREYESSGKLQDLDPKKQKYLIDVFTHKGRRHTMEDRHVVFPDLNAIIGRPDLPSQAFFAVYDGHGGVEAAKFAQAQVHLIIGSQPTLADDPKKSLHDGFLEADKQFLEKAEREILNCGATACAALVRDQKMYVSWLGDSQIMLVKGGQPIKLMDPHKPQREDEKKRIEDKSGVVVWFGAWRVNGVLAVARALGDRKLKQWVIGEPDTTEIDLDGTEDFLVLGCDGLWDYMDFDKVTEYVKNYRQQNNDNIQGIAKALAEHCLETLAGADNISIVVIFFNRP